MKSRASQRKKNRFLGIFAQNLRWLERNIQREEIVFLLTRWVQKSIMMVYFDDSRRLNCRTVVESRD